MHWVMNWAVMPPSQRPLMKKKTCTSWSIAWHAYLFDINCILAAQATFWEGQELNSKYALSDEKSSNASISKAPHEKRGKYFLFHSMTCLPFRYQLHLSCWGLLLRRARAVCRQGIELSQYWTSCFLEGPYWKRGQVLLLRLHFFKKRQHLATPYQ